MLETTVILILIYNILMLLSYWMQGEDDEF